MYLPGVLVLVFQAVERKRCHLFVLGVFDNDATFELVVGRVDAVVGDSTDKGDWSVRWVSETIRGELGFGFYVGVDGEVGLGVCNDTIGLK